MTSTSSFTKDIFTRLKQINNDVKLLKNSQDELFNKRCNELESRITRLETIIENKFDILFDKLSSSIKTNIEETNNDLLSKLNSIDNINIIDTKSDKSILSEDINNLDKLNNLHTESDINNTDINTYMGKMYNNSTVSDNVNLEEINDIIILE
jgi:hypothetical protein